MYSIRFGKKCYPDKQKLTEESVKEIKEFLRKGIKAKELAIKYNVTAAYIRRINRGEVWSWVE